jgi:hypothetical protein
MGATFASVLITIFVLCLTSSYPSVGTTLMFPKTPFVCFFGLFLLFSLIPWKWVVRFYGNGEAHVLSQCALKSQTADKRIGLYLMAVYFIAFCAVALINFSSVSASYRFLYGLVSAGILIDLARKIYCRLQFRSKAEGLVQWLLESMKSAGRTPNRDDLVEAFESTFSIISSYLKIGDIASLKLFCANIVENSDFWIRASTQLPGNADGINKDASVLDSYTIVEAMVAKRMASIARETLQSESLIALETVIWFDGKLSLAFHKRHASLGYLLLLSLSLTLQQVEGKIDRTSREIEYITMLSELIKAYIDRTISTRSSDRASIFRALALLESHLKESFRKDRTINPAFLMQPFAEVGQLIADEKYALMPDKDDIIAELRRLLSQFAALEGVRAQMDIGGEGTDTKASYQEDKPFLPH